MILSSIEKVNLDENQISQVINNLVKNSIEAIADKNQGIVKIECKQNKQYIEIEITDNGCGIPSDKLSEIFVPFFTTKADGNGIGLSLSRQIMQMHGAWIRCQSVEGKGTSFNLTFPI